MNNKENEISVKTAPFKRVISAQAEVWEGSNGTVSEIKSKFDVKKKTGADTVGKVQNTPTKSKVAAIQQKITSHGTRPEQIVTPSRTVSIPANKVTEMKQKITEVGEKTKSVTNTPSRSINIPMNKVNEIRKLLASLEKGARDNNDVALSSKKRAVIDARMNTVSDIMKWIEEMTQMKKQGNLPSSKKGIELPANRVHDMKNWLLDFQRHNKEHFVEGSKSGSKDTVIASKGTATDDEMKKSQDNDEAKTHNEVKTVHEETNPDVLAIISLLNEVDKQNKTYQVTGTKSVRGKNHQITKKADEKLLNSMNQMQDISRNTDVTPNASVKTYHFATSLDSLELIKEETNQEVSDQLEKEHDVDISMLPRQSEDSMTDDDSEYWEDVFTELSISSDEVLQAVAGDSVSEENVDGTEVRKLLDSFINCDDSKEQDIFEEYSEPLDYSEHGSQEHSSATLSKNDDDSSTEDDGCNISPGFKFEADFVNGFATGATINDIQLSAVEAASLVVKETISTMSQSKKSGHPIEVYVENPSSSVLVPWRANKKIVIDTKALKQKKKMKGKRFGRKLLKVLKRMVRITGNYESERSKEHHIALARTLSESDAASSAVSPLSRFSINNMTPRAPHVEDMAIDSYLPTTYGGKIENNSDIVPFKGSLTPDQSLASAFESGLSPDISEGSSASNYALVLSKSMNVTQHVQFMRGVFGSPTQRLGDKSGVVIGELSLVASSGEI